MAVKPFVQGMKKFPILAWHYQGFNRSPQTKVEYWRDLGINIATLPINLDRKDLVYETLNLCEQNGIKLILFDPRTHWRVLTKNGEQAYRQGVQQAINDFGSHPALFGFYIGDEPDAPDAADAFKALRINEEMAPKLTAFLNLLPWFDWIGQRMGTEAYGPYLDRVAKEGNPKVIGYDCYTQMWEGTSGYDVYFNNLREHFLSYKRNNVPFINTVLSIGHFKYRCPSKDDMIWQVSSSVAMGASGVMWFHLELAGVSDNARNAPINQLGDRTAEFQWLREANMVFNNYCGEIMNTLDVDEVYHVGEAFGGVELFHPIDDILEVKSSETPLIFSKFHNDQGQRFYVVCNNSPFNSTHFSIKTKPGTVLTHSVYGNRFEPMRMMSDPVGAQFNQPGQSGGFLLAPGQLAVLRNEPAAPEANHA